MKKFPHEERYAICYQHRRVSVFIISNIAEGVNTFSVKDKSIFIEIAYGSLIEVSSQYKIVKELGYITNDDRVNIEKLIEEVARLLSGLQNSYKPTTDSTITNHYFKLKVMFKV